MLERRGLEGGRALAAGVVACCLGIALLASSDAWRTSTVQPVPDLHTPLALLLTDAQPGSAAFATESCSLKMYGAGTRGTGGDPGLWISRTGGSRPGFQSSAGAGPCPTQQPYRQIGLISRGRLPPPLLSALDHGRARGCVVSVDGGREQAQEAAQLGREELEQAAKSYNKAAAAKAKRQAALNDQTRDAGDVCARTRPLCCICDTMHSFESARLGTPFASLAPST